MPDRRFPPPWIVDEQPACFVVRGHFYFEDEPGRKAAAEVKNSNSLC